MIHRFVCMEIRSECTEDFKKTLGENILKIKSFEGCIHLEILKDTHAPNRYFSYSIWKSAEDLENYRRSDFFRVFWKALKINFYSKAQAWSLESVKINMK